MERGLFLLVFATFLCLLGEVSLSKAVLKRVIAYSILDSLEIGKSRLEEHYQRRRRHQRVQKASPNAKKRPYTIRKIK